MSDVKYIKVYDGALSDDICDDIIKRFEEDVENQVPIEFEDEADSWVRSFTEINLAKAKGWEQIHAYLQHAAEKAVQQYFTDCGAGPRAIPPESAFEEFRIKRYLPNDQDEFAEHVDVGDHLSAKRFLVFFWYLNDVDEGGETYFTDLGKGVQPKKGRMLVFPPTWTYPHAGMKPVNGPKYIIGGYLHYL
jgi:hypothetical protein